MTFMVKAASCGSVLRPPTRTFMAFQIAQPRPRTQVAESTGSRSLKTRLLVPDRNVQAIVVSQAGVAHAAGAEIEDGAEPAVVK